MGRGTLPLPKAFVLEELSGNLVHKAEIVRCTPKGVDIKCCGLLVFEQAATSYLRRSRR